jgi:hypothetical protein
MTITITINSITDSFTGNPNRPIFIAIACTANIEGEIFTAPWNVCVNEITRVFPNVEFVTSWTGHVCTFIPVGTTPRFEVEPTCPVFERET